MHTSKIQSANCSGHALAQSTAYEVKQLDTFEELIQSYRLRYQIYHDLGYLRQPNKSKLDIDTYDGWAIPFGAFDTSSQTMIGTLRLITTEPQPRFSQLVQKVLGLFADTALARQVCADRPHVLPSIVSDAIEKALSDYNTGDFRVSELSRSVVRHRFRGSGVARSLMELGLARAAQDGPALLIGSYLPEHVPMYGKYGYCKLPNSGFELFDSVDQVAIAGVCRTDRLPEPTCSHVDDLLRAMRTKAAEPKAGADCGLCIQSRFLRTPGIGPCVKKEVG
jgi:predicted GNAT family N-acyltransferase